jgi:hypothetical protein
MLLFQNPCRSFGVVIDEHRRLHKQDDENFYTSLSGFKEDSIKSILKVLLLDGSRSSQKKIRC